MGIREETRGVLTEWRASPEWSQAKATFMWLFGGGLVLVLLGSVIALDALIPLGPDEGGRGYIFGELFIKSLIAKLIGGGLLLSGLVVSILAFVRKNMVEADFRWRQLQEARRNVDLAAQRLDPTKLKSIIEFNKQQTDQYHALTKAQAADSYKRAQFAMFLGFLVLVFGVVFSLASDEAIAKVTTASLTGLGALLSGFLGKTFLDTYRSALDQLNYYFQQPLVTSYLISAERLAGSLRGSQKDVAVNRIIDRILNLDVMPRSGTRLRSKRRTATPGDEENRGLPPTSQGDGGQGSENAH
jgi:hypothetical protein